MALLQLRINLEKGINPMTYISQKTGMSELTFSQLEFLSHCATVGPPVPPKEPWVKEGNVFCISNASSNVLGIS
jgi:hypothetical protein